jgi:RNA polymerase sigma factor FliA
MSQSVEPHLPFVRRVARRISKRSRACPAVDFDDLVQAGTMGLLEAAERFDPRHGVTFRAFAKKRVIGAMYDELRRLDRLSAATVSLEAAGSNDGKPLAEVVEHSRADSLTDLEASAGLTHTKRLDQRHRLVLACAAAGYRQTEIGVMLGVSPSRVRQLLDKIRSADGADAQKPLSEREREVLAATADGLTAKEVADELAISPATVQDHRRNAASKLGARNTINAVAVAYEQGLLPLSQGARPPRNGK